MKCSEIYIAMLEAVKEYEERVKYLKPKVSKKEKQILELDEDYYEIWKKFSQHARRRAFKRFKDFSLKEIIKDYVESSFLRNSWRDKDKIKRIHTIGKIGIYVITENAIVISILPLSKKTKTKQPFKKLAIGRKKK